MYLRVLFFSLNYEFFCKICCFTRENRLPFKVGMDDDPLVFNSSSIS